jgi:hypothetical protein
LVPSVRAGHDDYESEIYFSTIYMILLHIVEPIFLMDKHFEDIYGINIVFKKNKE